MKNITKYALFCGCILALSSCQEKGLEVPSYEVDESAPISFSTGVAGTKGLIENQASLDNTNTRIKVFDFMKVGDQPEVKYIDDAIKGKGGDGDWSYLDDATTYYWTKTGTHTFFGYLTQDPSGKAFSGEASMTGKVLTVSGSLTPDTTPQFDFLYSDIITRDAAITTDRKTVDLNMLHLFTSLAVEVVNQTGAEIRHLSVSFNNVFPEQSAEINWGKPIERTIGKESSKIIYSPDVKYSPERTSANAKALDLNESPINSVPISVYSEKEKKWSSAPLFFDVQNKLEYRLLWPQTILPASGSFAGSQVSIKYDGCVAPRVATLYYDEGDDNADVIFEGNKLEPNKKYLLTITIKNTVLELKVVVDPLVELYYGKEGYDDYLLTPIN